MVLAHTDDSILKIGQSIGLKYKAKIGFVSSILLITMSAVMTMPVGVANALEKVVVDGFSFTYPSNWNFKEKENRFTSIDATLEYDKGSTSGTILFEHDRELSDALPSVNQLDSLKNLLLQTYEGSSIFETGTDKYFINNQSSPYAIATFRQMNLLGFETEFVAMAIVINLGDNDRVFARYTSHEDNFDKLLTQAEHIFQSVKPEGSAAANVL